MNWMVNHPGEYYPKGWQDVSGEIQIIKELYEKHDILILDVIRSVKNAELCEATYCLFGTYHLLIPNDDVDKFHNSFGIEQSFADKSEFVASLKHQLESGIAPEDITCKEKRMLVLRTNGNIACVTERTAERTGWEIINDHIPNESINNDKNSDIIISTGVWSGECIGYCSSGFTITSEKIDYFRSGYSVYSPIPATFPDITKEFPISETEWQDLLHSVELQTFNSLPDRIGCAGCLDAPVHWIEISVDNNTKRISYESKDYIPAIDGLRLKLMNMSKLVGSVIYNFEGCVDAGNPIVQTWPRHCITEDGLKYVKTSVDNSEECVSLGFKVIEADSRKLCITKSNQYVGVIE